MFEDQGRQDYFNLMGVLSFWIALLNLEQNIEQSKAQDIHKANDKQQKEMLQEIHNEFEAQNERLSLIEHRLDKIIQELGGNKHEL